MNLGDGRQPCHHREEGSSVASWELRAGERKARRERARERERRLGGPATRERLAPTAPGPRKALNPSWNGGPQRKKRQRQQQQQQPLPAPAPPPALRPPSLPPSCLPACPPDLDESSTASASFPTPSACFLFSPLTCQHYHHHHCLRLSCQSCPNPLASTLNTFSSSSHPLSGLPVFFIYCSFPSERERESESAILLGSSSLTTCLRVSWVRGGGCSSCSACGSLELVVLYHSGGGLGLGGLVACSWRYLSEPFYCSMGFVAVSTGIS